MPTHSGVREIKMMSWGFRQVKRIPGRGCPWDGGCRSFLPFGISVSFLFGWQLIATWGFLLEDIRGLFRSLFKIWFLFSFLNDSILKKKPRWQPRLAFHSNLNILAFSEMSKSGTSTHVLLDFTVLCYLVILGFLLNLKINFGLSFCLLLVSLVM